MRHQVIAAPDLTGSLSPPVPCVPVKPTPATRPHAGPSGASSAKPVPLSSVLPTPPSPPSARAQFPELAACATFDTAIASSRVYSQPNISAKADAAGRRLLAAGLGVDQTLPLLRPTSSTFLTTAYAICSSNVLTTCGTAHFEP